MDIFSIVSVILDGFGFAGGGGSGGGGGGHSSHHSSHGGSGGFGEPWDTIYTIAVLVLYVGAIVSTIRNKRKRDRARKLAHSKYTEKDLNKIEQARYIFVQYQIDWTNLDFKNMKTYMTDRYYQHACLMLEAISSMSRQNIVSQLTVKDVDFKDFIITSPVQSFNIEFAGRDALYDADKKKYLLNHYVQQACETWQFVEGKDGKILLDKIIQPTRSLPHSIQALSDFADKNKLFYSQDWGRYAMPNNGLIFKGVNFNVADINNHIVGKWDNILIQLYTYSKTVTSPSKYYLVGQLTVPKKYSGIIVRNKNAKRLKIPRGYDQYELEWEDFNKHFELFATDPDKIPSFELLNPKFMVHLYDHGIECSLEVIDNKIYIFANNTKCTEKEYGSMLDILTEAYHELKY